MSIASDSEARYAPNGPQGAFPFRQDSEAESDGVCGVEVVTGPAKIVVVHAIGVSRPPTSAVLWARRTICPSQKRARYGDEEAESR